MAALPAGFHGLRDRVVGEAEGMEGHLTGRESRFLYLLGSCPTAPGEVLEIGSFKGRSTVILARASELAGEERVAAVDPLTSPSSTDPDLGGAGSGLADFRANLERGGVAGRVEFHQTTSRELARSWDRPLRLLWIDGDHTYPGAKADLDDYLPHVADGGIVALHDVLHRFEGPVRVFLEDLVLSDHFGPTGLAGSIGWGRYHRDPRGGRPWREQRAGLYRRLSRLVPDMVLRERLSGWRMLRYKALRALVPHGEPRPERWLESLETPP